MWCACPELCCGCSTDPHLVPLVPLLRFPPPTIALLSRLELALCSCPPTCLAPLHSVAVRSMRRATPPDMQADNALWQRVHDVMHGLLERAFNEVTEAAAAREEQLAVRQLQAQLLPPAGALLDAAWPGWDVWEGVVGWVMRAVDAALTQAATMRPADRRENAAAQQVQQAAQLGQAGPAVGVARPAERHPAQQPAQLGQEEPADGGAPAAPEQQQPQQQAQLAAGGWLQRALLVAAGLGRGGPVPPPVAKRQAA